MLTMTALPLDWVDAQSDGTASGLFQEVTRSIVAGTIPSGETVSENYLAERYGVSRTSVREVLFKLQALGLVHRRRNRTVFVAPLSLAEMEDLSATRECLERLIVRQAAQRVAAKAESLDELTTINQRIARLAEIGDVPLALEFGLKFHNELMRMSGNAVASRHLQMVLLLLERYRQLVQFGAMRTFDVHLEHERLLAAMRRGDVDAAETAVSEHIRNGRQFYRTILQGDAYMAASQA